MRINQGIRRSDVGTKISWLHLKQTISHRKDKDWSATMNGLFLVSIVAYFLCCGQICSFFASHYVVRSWLRDILTTNPLKPRGQIPQYVELTKRFLKKKEEKCVVGEKELLDIKGHLLSWNRSLRLWLRSQDCLASPILYKIPRDVWKPRLELVI